jgi:hypothetical protein
MSWDACMNSTMPCTATSFGRKRWITCDALASRSSRDFRLMNMRPLLTDELMVPAPTAEMTPSTAGSRVMISTSARWRSIMAL